MTQDQLTCESCGMPIESGRYCTYCTDSEGNLQDFDTRFAAMVEWQRRETPEASTSDIEAKTRAHMATLPAWRHHPKLAGVGRD